MVTEVDMSTELLKTRWWPKWRDWLDATDTTQAPEPLPGRYGGQLLLLAAFSFNHDVTLQFQAAVLNLGLSAVLIYVAQLIIFALPAFYLEMVVMKMCQRGMIASIYNCVPIASGLALPMIISACLKMLKVNFLFSSHLAHTQHFLQGAEGLKNATYGRDLEVFTYAQSHLNESHITGQMGFYFVSLLILYLVLSSIRWSRLAYFLYWLAGINGLILLIRFFLALVIDGRHNDFATFSSLFNIRMEVATWRIMSGMMVRTTMIGTGLIPIIYSRTPSGENVLSQTLLVIMFLFWAMIIRAITASCTTGHLLAQMKELLVGDGRLSNGLEDSNRVGYYTLPLEFFILRHHFDASEFWAVLGGVWSVSECLLTSLLTIEVIRRNLLEFIGIWRKESVGLRVGVSALACFLLFFMLIPPRFITSVFIDHSRGGYVEATSVLLECLVFIGFYGIGPIQVNLKRLGQIVPPRWLMFLLLAVMFPLGYLIALILAAVRVDGNNPEMNHLNELKGGKMSFEQTYRGWNTSIDSAARLFRWLLVAMPFIWAIFALLRQKCFLHIPLKELWTPQTDFKDVQKSYLGEVFNKKPEEQENRHGVTLVMERRLKPENQSENPDNPHTN